MGKAAEDSPSLWDSAPHVDDYEEATGSGLQADAVLAKCGHMGSEPADRDILPSLAIPPPKISKTNHLPPHKILLRY